MNNTKGFSLVEMVVSAGAFAVFAILIQNVLLLAHSFQLSQKNLLETFQISQMIKQRVCMANSSWTGRNIDEDSSYIKKQKLDDPGGGAVAVHSTRYDKLQAQHNDDGPLLGLIILEEDPSLNTLIPVQQDSHTLVVLNSSHQTLQQQANTNKSADFLSGYIFASRCVPVSPDSIKTTANGYRATFDSSDLNASAKTILLNKERPYYFPQSTQKLADESVFCCKDGSDYDKCRSLAQSAIRKYAPRIYVIHFVRSEIDIPSSSSITPAFAGEITAIQELPELHDMDTMWGTGFMLSMSKKSLFSSSTFHLDIMTLKNTCSTSLNHIKNCASLSLAKNPNEQKLIGLEGSDLNMGQFITANISSCSGYSTGIDTTSAITF